MKEWPLKSIFVLAAFVVAASGAVAGSESHCTPPDGVVNVTELSSLPSALRMELEKSYPDLQSERDFGQPHEFLQAFNKGEVWAVAYSYCDNCRLALSLVISLRQRAGSVIPGPQKKIARGDVCLELKTAVSVPHP